ncbi:MAG: hypothetical protein M1839_008749 [Geoglossum umbratile]|nr:MAG: hypothetical protein M1839_008749 [Geoglossum umbratile]
MVSTEDCSTHKAGLSPDSFLKGLNLIPTIDMSLSPTDVVIANNIEIIGYDLVSARPDADIKALARNMFETVLETGTYNRFENPHVYGNPRGHQLISSNRDLHTRVTALESLVSSQGDRINSQDNRISGLQTQIEELKEASEGYRHIRQRFLDVFRRDILGSATARYAGNIDAGNAAAHHGDAVADAGLYEGGFRNDKSLMTIIYGISPDQVLFLRRAGDNASIDIINSRATLKADKNIGVPTDVETAFIKYLLILEDHWGNSPAEDPQSALGQAYSEFWSVHGKYKR